MGKPIAEILFRLKFIIFRNNLINLYPILICSDITYLSFIPSLGMILIKLGFLVILG